MPEAVLSTTPPANVSLLASSSITLAATQLEPLVDWAFKGFARPAPANVTALIAVGLVLVMHVAQKFVASKIGPKIPVVPTTVVAMLAVVVGLGVAACTTSGTPLTPPQVAVLELTIATAAENVAQEAESTPGLSAQAVQAIKSGGLALSAAAQANVAVLANGGSTSQQLQAAGLAALVPLVNNLGNLLAANPTGSPVDAKAAALTGAADLLQQLPAVIGVSVQLNGGWVPGAPDVAAAVAALQAAAGKL